MIATVFSSAVPSDPPTCWLALTMALGRARVVLVDADQRDVAQRHEVQPEAGAEDQLGRQDVAASSGVHADAGQQHHAGRRDEPPVAIRGFGPIRGSSPLDERRASRKMPTVIGSVAQTGCIGV